MLSQIESIWSDYTEIVCIISVNSDWAVQKKKKKLPVNYLHSLC